MTIEAAQRSFKVDYSVLAFFLLAANLRPALTSVGPVLEAIRSSLGLSGAAAGLHRVAMRLEGWNESVPGAILRDGRARARPPQDEVHWVSSETLRCLSEARRRLDPSALG